MGSRDRNYVVLNLLRGRRIGEVELVREIGDLLDEFFERNIFLVWREVSDAQATIGVWFVFLAPIQDVTHWATPSVRWGYQRTNRAATTEPQSCPMRTCGRPYVSYFRQGSDYKTYSFRGTDLVEKSSEIVGELFKRIFLRFIGLISLTITQHIRGDDTVASFDPRANLVFPGNPNSRRITASKDIYTERKTYQRSGNPWIRRSVMVFSTS